MKQACDVVVLNHELGCAHTFDVEVLVVALVKVEIFSITFLISEVHHDKVFVIGLTLFVDLLKLNTHWHTDLKVNMSELSNLLIQELMNDLLFHLLHWETFKKPSCNCIFPFQHVSGEK